MVSITVTAAGNRAPSFARKYLPLTVDVPTDASVRDVKAKIAERIRKFSSSRQKLSLEGEKKTLDDDIKIATLGVKDLALDVKDLGPQIGWQTVFFIEYFGPLFFHFVIYNYPHFCYFQNVDHSRLQKVVYAFVMLHFIKRELETLFVHRFSHGTMPFFNLFKNSGHYHVLAGLFLAFDVYRPVYSPSSSYIKSTFRDNETYLWVFAVFELFFELSNFYSHMIMRNLRPAGTRKRGIPYGYAFNLVSFPNYFFEFLEWGLLAVFTNSYAAYLFWIVADIQMIIWAVKKHKAYEKEFGKEYPKNRKAMIPFIL